MIDQNHINLLDLIGQDTNLKYAASTDGGEYKGACPFCGGTDRFCVWPEEGRFWCRQCGENGDAIDYVQKTQGLSFPEACAALRVERPKQGSHKRRSSSPKPAVKTSSPKSWVALEDLDWQEAAVKFCQHSYDTLWSEAGDDQRAYLHERGLNDDIIQAARIGFNSQSHKELWSFALDKDVYLPEGIVIPWQIDDKLWRVNIRQPQDRTPKYIQAAGGANGLYRADDITFGCTLIIVEGEFDALVLLSQLPAELVCQHQIVPVATGSATGSRSRQWLGQVALAERVLLAFDNDDEGLGAVAWWANALGTKATNLRPTQHDVTDMVKAGDDLETWLLTALK